MKDYTSIKKIILIIVIIIAIISSCVYGIIYYKKQEKESFEVSDNLIKPKIKNTNKSSNEEKSNLVVDIKGEIQNPGIYRVEKNTRVIDVINMAGGLTANADTSVINLSKKITDEMVIIIYSKQEVINFIETKKQEQEKLSICNEQEVVNGACIKDSSTTNNEDNITGKININTATTEELQNLPGIGEAKAKNIVKYREENGNFTKIEDLKEVPGIGDSIYDQIKDYITI